MGSIPFGFILTKIFLKKDIREIGSGNIGATNALRTGNKVIGYLTLILDILKAVAPVIYVKTFYQDFIYIASLCAFLGHVFPIWLKFKGGKGIATSLGVILSIDIFIGLCLLTIWILVFLIFKISSLSALISSTSFPILIFFKYEKVNLLYLSILLTIFVFFTHRANIIRLLKKEEKKI